MVGKCLFVTGTGTDIGKTYVTGLIVKKLKDSGVNAGYYKAALSGATVDAAGNLEPGDVLHVKQTAKLDTSVSDMVSYVYREAVSPHLAAKLNGEVIDFAKIKADFTRAKTIFEYLTVEGSGGIVCPLRFDETKQLLLADVVCRLSLPVLIVADAGLGTINGTVLTIHYLNDRHIPVKGVIFNNSRPGDVMEEDNAITIEKMTGVKVLARVKKGDTELFMESAALTALYE